MVDDTLSAAPEPPVRAGRAPRPAPDVLVDGFREAVVSTDAAGVVRYLNRSAADLFPGTRPGTDAAAAGLAPDGPDAVELTLAGRFVRGRRVRVDGDTLAWYLCDVTAEVAERRRADFLVRCARRLGRLLHVGHTAGVAADLAVPDLAETAVVLLPAAEGGVRWWRAGAPGGAAATHGWLRVADLSATVVQALRFGGAPRAALLTGRDAELCRPEALVVPLPGGDGPAGVLLLGGVGPAASADPLVGEFADRCGQALTAASLFADQASLAATLRSALRPAALPPTPGLAVGAAYRPGRRTGGIGGDFYEVYPPVGGGTDLLFALGDVCGNGVEAGVLAGRLRHCLQALRRLERRPQRLLDLVNETMLDIPHGADDAVRFVTMVVGRVRRAGDTGADFDVELADAGHLPVFVLRRDGGVDSVALRGVAVGVAPDARFPHTRVRLAPGDSLVLVSDGVTEARGPGGELYGLDRLVAALCSGAGMPAAALAERIDMLVGDWLAGGEHDDIAVLCVQAPA